jgi:hypothetical protein
MQLESVVRNLYIEVCTPHFSIVKTFKFYFGGPTKNTCAWRFRYHIHSVAVPAITSDTRGCTHASDCERYAV